MFRGEKNGWGEISIQIRWRRWFWVIFCKKKGYALGFANLIIQKKPLEKNLYCFFISKLSLYKIFSLFFVSSFHVPYELDFFENIQRLPYKTIQNTPFKQHTIFSNTEMLCGGFLLLFLYIFLQYVFFFNWKSGFHSFINLDIFFFYIYRNVIPQNLNSLLRLVVAKRTFAVCFHAKAIFSGRM